MQMERRAKRPRAVKQAINAGPLLPPLTGKRGSRFPLSPHSGGSGRGCRGGGVRGALPLSSRGLLCAWVIGVHPPVLTFLTTATIVWLARVLWSTRVATTHRFANAFPPPLACGQRRRRPGPWERQGARSL